jgi:5'(3')-deoxyribonucleotidase
VLFVTSPWLTCVGWADVRREWLARRFSGLAEELVVTLRKDVVIGDVLVDDKADHVVAWHHAMQGLGKVPQAYLFSMAHNAADQWPLRWAWDAVPVHLTRRV